MSAQALFAAGCFWGIESTFRRLPGVLKTTVGYTGGTSTNPTYKQVCSGVTNHAEVVLVEFDSLILSYKKLLETFWACHNPTTPNRQGPDIGTQYRSAIFYFDQHQKEAAETFKDALDQSKKYPSKIVTEICAASVFYPAEEYHQQYHEKMGGSCRIF